MWTYKLLTTERTLKSVTLRDAISLFIGLMLRLTVSCRET